MVSFGMLPARKVATRFYGAVITSRDPLLVDIYAAELLGSPDQIQYISMQKNWVWDLGPGGNSCELIVLIAPVIGKILPGRG